tara:strand:+ start:252 stop:2276 length:2025 start_codon:yes stop_codon:yes gene_type:complete
MIKFFKILVFFFLPITFTYLGYVSKNIFDLNIDIYYLHSVLLIIILLFLLILDFFFKKYQVNKYLRIFGLSLLSSSVFGVALSIIQVNLINTTQLELGRFAINDASDYLNQSIDYLYNKEFYTEKGRVIFPILYAGFLGELKLNTTLIQIIITLMASMITFCSAICLYKYYGYLSALVFTTLSVDFLFEHIGGTSTETTGYLLGSIAFIFFLKFINVSKDKLFYFIFFLVFLLLSYLVRPSYPIFIPLILLWCFVYIRKRNIMKVYQFFLITFSILFLVTSTNKFLTHEKSSLSAKEFGNVYDSWYAVHELGKFFLNDNYDKLPSTLWTKIIEDNPELQKLQGNDYVEKKKEIFFRSLQTGPENYIVGSFLQILKFFEVSFIYDEIYNNTGGFLHIDFVFYRILIILTFTFSGFMSLYIFLKNKNFEYFLPGIIFISVLLSQPFIYGGEARTAAPVIMFLNLVVITPILKLKELLVLKKFDNLNSVSKIQFNRYYLNSSIFLVVFFLFFFFYKGLNNSFSYIRENYHSKVECLEGYTPKKIIFNSKSGFYINSKGESNNKKQNDFSDYLNYIIDLNNIYIKNGKDLGLIGVTKEEAVKKNKFKVLDPLLKTSDGRLLRLSDRERKLFSILGRQYLSNGGFFINPINIETGKLEGLIILDESMVKKGLNVTVACL